MLNRLETCPLIAIVRRRDEVDLSAVVQSLWDGGIRAVEITSPTPGGLSAVTALRRLAEPGQSVGVGTVTNLDEARLAVDAGAEFLVTPMLDLAVVAYARERGIGIFPGAFSPTEILTAHRAGATAVKVFPAAQLGPGYLKNVLAPLPELRLVPTGGITLDNVPQWLEAGATALGVGSALVRDEMINSANWDGLAEWAKQWARRASPA
ncbi:MAG: bifunctional 4-hydroxy-2-oxoglutarate aldolase/2-dehydro-3-deoxy-phosphogluconate aldolase [Planctomycetota bacterium]